MIDYDDFPTLLERARRTITLLEDLKIPPLPPRFAVGYTHLGSEAQDLSLSINRLLSHGKLTAEAIDQLYEQFINHDERGGELQDASRRIEHAVTAMSSYLGSAAGSARQYGEVLSAFSEQARTFKVSPEMERIIEETRRMIEANQGLQQRLQDSSREIADLRDHLDRLERDANTDALTGISNRKNFDKILVEATQKACRDRQPLSLVMLDVDSFKKYNDTYGHQLGDQVLRLVARHIRECSDERYLTARYGGDEFSVILPGSAIAGALDLANRIRDGVSTKTIVHRRSGTQVGRITLSLGAAEFRPGESIAELVHRADEALFLAKANGRDRVASEGDLPPPSFSDDEGAGQERQPLST